MSTVLINNPSFEVQSLSDSGSATTVTSWSISGGGSETGVWNAPAGRFTPQAPEGQNIVYHDTYGSGSDRVLSQTLSETLTANTSYTLTAKVAFPTSASAQPYAVQLVADGEVLAQDDNTLTLSAGTWVTSTVSFTTGASHAKLGQAMEIRLVGRATPSGTYRQVEFDQIALDKQAAPQPPSAPSGLTATASGGDVQLHWTDNASDETGFLIERAAGSGSFSTVAILTGANQTSYADTPAVRGTSYSYRVKAVHSGVASSASGTATITPAAPTTTTAVSITNAGFEAVSLSDGTWNTYIPSWTVSGPGNAYGTWNDNGSYFSPVQAPEGQNMIYLDTNGSASEHYAAQTLSETLARDTTYTLTVSVGVGNNSPAAGYAVQLWAGGVMLAQDDNSQTLPSGGWTTSTVSFTTGVSHPKLGSTLEVRLVQKASPSSAGYRQVEFDNVQLTKGHVQRDVPAMLKAATGSEDSIHLSWLDTDAETGYTVYMSADNGATYTTAGTTAAGVTSLSLDGLPASTPYQFYVTATNTGGPSAPSTAAQGSTDVLGSKGMVEIPAGANLNDAFWFDGGKVYEAGKRYRFEYIDGAIHENTNNTWFTSYHYFTNPELTPNGYVIHGLASGQPTLEAAEAETDGVFWFEAADLPVGVVVGYNGGSTNTGPGVRFRLLELPVTTGTIYNDLNADGDQDSGEPGLSGLTGDWRVYNDLNNNGVFDYSAAESYTFPDANGDYKFDVTGADPGSGDIRVVPPLGWVQTTPTGGYDRPAWGLLEDQDFGFYQPPTVTLDSVTSITEGDTATLTGTIQNPAGGSVSLTLNWGDGSTTIHSFGETTTPISLTHVYSDDNPTNTPEDEVTITANIVNSFGGVATASKQRLVRNAKPVVSAAVSTPIIESGIAVVEAGDVSHPFTATGSFADAGLDTWTGTVDWGDGQTGSVTLNPDKTFSLSHVYANPYNYTIKVKVADDDGGEDEKELNVKVLSLETLRATEIADDGATIQAAGTTAEHLYVAKRPGTYDARIKIERSILPTVGPLEHVLWSVAGSGASVTSGNFSAASPEVTLTPSPANRSWIVTAGFDSDGDGTLDAGEIDRTVKVHIVQVELDLAIVNPTLLEENTYTTTVDTGGPATPNNYYVEIRRDGESTWYSYGASQNAVRKAKVAGSFWVRSFATVNGRDFASEEMPLIVQFPTAAAIANNFAVSAAVNAAWQSTLAATTPTQRREEGFWIMLNTATELYEFGLPIVQDPPSGPDERASVPMGAPPPDTIQNPLPTDEPTYTVTYLHTHTALTFRPNASARGVGPSDEDIAKDNHFGIPGLVYDYLGDSNHLIHSGHNLNDTAVLYRSGPERRIK